GEEMSASRALAGIGLLGSALGCTSLPDIDARTCGNGVVETGEDCDSKSDPACRPPGSEGEGRYDCSRLDDQTRPGCKKGLCGLADGICRVPTGAFDLGQRPESGGVVALRTGDFDADGRADIVGVESDRLSIHFFDNIKDYAESLVIRGASAAPA